MGGTYKYEEVPNLLNLQEYVKEVFICTPSGGNVRENKLTSSKILGVLDNYAKFNLYRKEGDWIHIIILQMVNMFIENI